jgi:hypothetical protein
VEGDLQMYIWTPETYAGALQLAAAAAMYGYYAAQYFA